MSGFFYFLPGMTPGDVAASGKPRHDAMANCGIADVLRDVEAIPDDAVLTEVHSGPNGKTGVCLYPKCGHADNPLTWTYNATRQQWIDASGYWIGWDREQQPQPVDLQRKCVLSDYSITDANGREWHVPCARSVDSQRSSLPVEYAFAGDDLVRHIAPAYMRLWKLSGQVLDHLRGGMARDEAWLVRAALEVLQVNYRLAPPHITALQMMGLAVLTRTTVMAILFALVDNDLEQEVLEQKKTSTTDSRQDN